MNIQLKTKHINADDPEAQALQVLVANGDLSIPGDKQGGCTLERIFTSKGKAPIYRCQLAVKLNKHRSVTGSRSGSNLTLSAQEAFQSVLDQLDYLSRQA